MNNICQLKKTILFCCLWLLLGEYFYVHATVGEPLNLITNSGFELPVNSKEELTGFRITKTNAKSNALFDWEMSSDARSGEKSLWIEMINNEEGACIYLNTPEIRTEKSEYRRFVLTWWTKRPVENEGISLIPQFFNSNWSGGARIIRRITYANISNYHDWIKEGVLVEMRPNSEIIRIRWKVSSKTPKTGILIDDVKFIEVTKFDEELILEMLSPTNINTSDSKRHKSDKRIINEKNILFNSSFELGLTNGWSLPGSIRQKQAKAFITDNSYFGSNSVCLINQKDKNKIESTFFQIQPFVPYTLSCWSRTDTKGLILKLSIKSGYTDSKGITQGYIKEYHLSEKWEKYKITVTLEPSPQNSYFIEAEVVGNKKGKLFIDGIQFQEGQGSVYAPKFEIEGNLFSSHWPSNLYGWDEKIDINLKVVNYTENRKRCNLSWELVDFYDKKIAGYRIMDEIDPLEVRVIPIKLPESIKGSFHLLLKKENNIMSETTLTVVPPFKHNSLCKESRFGGHMGYSMYAISVAKKLGVNWIRHHDCTKITSWDVVEAEPGKWRWYDDQVDLMRNSGIEIMGVLGRVPPWQMSDEDQKRMPKGGWARFKSMDSWKDYVFNVVEHYKGKIDYWEVWNEPFGFGVNGDGEFYLRLCKTAYLAAKSANPNSKIIGLCTSAFTNKFNKYFFSNGGADFCDIISFHHYTTDAKEDSPKSPALHAKNMISLVKKYSTFNKPVWMTEGGQGYISSWHITVPKNAVDNMYTQRMAPGGALSNEKAARCWARYVPMMLSEGVDKIFHYWQPWKSNVIRASNPDGFTWFEYDGSLKPFAAVYAVGAYLLDNSNPVESYILLNEIVIRKYQHDSEIIYTLWADTNNAIEIDFNQFSDFKLALDMFGNELTTDKGRYFVGNEIIYLICNKMIESATGLLIKKLSRGVN